jgi:glucan phosphoethanolaminetransferase (alkaline phosphatase superfamily)
MLALSLVTWWYGKGWAATIARLEAMITGISRLFSVPILLRTLFSPWKRIVSYPGASLDAKLRAMADNMVSRAVGFVVRILVLLTALTIEALACCLGVVWVVAWPCIPLFGIVLLIKGILG